MGVVQALRQFVDGERALYECRHCGTSLECEAEHCPCCGTTEIARYEF